MGKLYFTDIKEIEVEHYNKRIFVRIEEVRV